MKKKVDLEEDIDEQKFEIDNDQISEIETEEEEEAKSFKQIRKERKRLYISDSLFNLISEAEEIGKQKIILLIVDNAIVAKEALHIFKDKKSVPKIERLTIGNITIIYDIKQIKKIKPDFIFIHVDCNKDFINEVGMRIKFKDKEIEEVANAYIKKDANRELCRKCKEVDPESLPYGEETGHIEWQPQFDSNGKPLLDENENQLYIEFPELECDQGHRWFKGEGARRNVKGKNPVLLDSHLKMKEKREILAESGVPDPAYNKDRFGRPSQLMYNRSHPEGRKINSEDQRRKSGASYYR